MPRLEFNTGIDTTIFISRERDDARYFRHGYCYMEPDHGHYHWDQSNFDESHFCLEGRIQLRVEDAAGRQIVSKPAGRAHLPARRLQVHARSDRGEIEVLLDQRPVAAGRPRRRQGLLGKAHRTEGRVTWPTSSR